MWHQPFIGKPIGVWAFKNPSFLGFEWIVLGRCTKREKGGGVCVCVCGKGKGSSGDMWQDAKPPPCTHFASAMCNVMWVGLVFENRIEMLHKLFFVAMDYLMNHVYRRNLLQNFP
jgi:hypothetical protein